MTDKTEDEMWAEVSAERAGTVEAESPAPEEERRDDDGADDTPADDVTDDAADDASAEAEDEARDDAGDESPDGETEDLAAQVKRLEHSLNSVNGRYKAERERSAKDRRRIEELQARLAEVEQPRETDKQRKEAIAQARKDYPDVVGPLADRFDDYERDAQERAKRQRTADEQEFARITAEEQSLFEKEHPDGFDTIAKDPRAFRAWIDDQPKHVRDSFEQNREAITDGVAAAYVVGLYKQSFAHSERVDPVAERRRRQMAGATADRARTSARGTSAPPKEADDDAQWEYVRRLRERRSAS